MHYLVEKVAAAHSEKASRIVSAILSDVTDRRGWRQEWDQFDDGIRDEIIAKWFKLVEAELDR